MGYEFTPAERIANIMWVLDQLQDRLVDSNDNHRTIWESAIGRVLMALDVAIIDMAAEASK